MNEIAALGAGLGLGVIHFGGLWLTVRRALPARGWLWTISGSVRLLLAALILGVLAWHGAGPLLAALAGWWMVRTGLLFLLRRGRHG